MPATPDRTVELYSFWCARCGGAWSQEYDVVRHQDCSGDISEHYSRHSVPCCAPAGVSCPHCGGLRVKLHPFSLRDSH